MTHRSHQAGMITLAEFIRFGVKTLIGIVLARILLPGEFGSYRQLFLLYSTFSALLLLGIPQSILYFLPKISDAQQRKAYVGKIIDLTGFLALVFCIVLIMARGLVARSFSNPDLEILILIYAGYPVFMFITQVFSFIMISSNKADKAAKFTIFSVLTDAVLIIGTALYFRNLIPVLFGVMLAAFVQWTYARVSLKNISCSSAWDRDFIRSQFRYSLPLGLSSIIGMLSMQLDKFVISGFFTPEQFAVFSVGAMELPFITIFSNSINSVLLPGISSQDNTSEVAKIYRGAVRKNALIILPMATLFFLFAEPIIVFLYSSRYIAAVPFFKVYTLILPLRIATFGIIFMALGKTRQVLYNAVFTLTANLVLNLVLVRYMGMMGAALATVLVTWMAAALYVIWMKTKLHLKLSEFFHFPPLIRTAGACLGAGLTAYFAMMSIPHQLLSLTVAFCLFIGVYFLLGLWLKAILPYDIAIYKEFLSKLLHRGKGL
jgi:O-antigen/teichoic acid export membrane protein